MFGVLDQIVKGLEIAFKSVDCDWRVEIRNDPHAPARVRVWTPGPPRSASRQCELIITANQLLNWTHNAEWSKAESAALIKQLKIKVMGE